MSAPRNNAAVESVLVPYVNAWESAPVIPNYPPFGTPELRSLESRYTTDPLPFEVMGDNMTLRQSNSHPPSPYPARVDEFLAKLPKVVLLDLSQGTECMICKEEYSSEFSNENPVRLPCHHVVGDACIKSWFENAAMQCRGEATCPMCRRVFFVTSNQFVWNSHYDFGQLLEEETTPILSYQGLTRQTFRRSYSPRPGDISSGSVGQQEDIRQSEVATAAVEAARRDVHDVVQQIREGIAGRAASRFRVGTGVAAGDEAGAE